MALKNVTGHKDIHATTHVDEHVTQLFLFDFEQSGIHLDKEKRSQVVYLNDLILYTGQQFASNSTKPSVVKRDTIPISARNL